MRKATGNKNIAPMVCLNAVRNQWRVRLEITETEDGAEWYEEDFNYRPSADEIRQLYNELVNEQVRQQILNGFMYEGKAVYLSEENQLNFRSAASTPVRFKLGENEDGNPVYHTFESSEELASFNKQMSDYIVTCLNDGYQRKDAFKTEYYLKE